MTVREVLNLVTHQLEDHRVENPRLNAELLLANCMNLEREGLYARLQDSITEKEKKEIDQKLQRRVFGEPLQYILGKQEFWSIGFDVDSRVLIPRPETEILVEQALFILSEMSFERKPIALDIGTGSGAVAVSLAKERKDLSVVATDISIEALILARENARRNGVLSQIEFVYGDLFLPIKEKESFDLILSNPPYITRAEIKRLSREVKDYEPAVALDGGEDGLDFYRKIVFEASFYLRKEGWLLLEIGQGQHIKVLEFVEEKGFFKKAGLIRDLSGIERVVKAQKIQSTKSEIRNKLE
jgi:release factor glutamine methyltransferase